MFFGFLLQGSKASSVLQFVPLVRRVLRFFSFGSVRSRCWRVPFLGRSTHKAMEEKHLAAMRSCPFCRTVSN